MTIKRTDSKNVDFKSLVAQLDEYLNGVFGAEQAIYDQFNKVDNSHVIVAYIDAIPVGCGCLRKYNDDKAELKRMFVPVEHRGKGVAGRVLLELEKWASELNYDFVILETGAPMSEANNFYKNRGYVTTEKFAPYKDSERSVCMMKIIDINL